MTYPYRPAEAGSAHAAYPVYVPTPSTGFQIGSITVSGAANKKVVYLSWKGFVFAHPERGSQPLLVRL